MATSAQEPVEHPSAPRFLTLKDVQAELQISPEQAMSLIRRGDPRALQIGGRGQWRIERVELEAYLQRQYEAAARSIAAQEATADSG